MGHSQMMNKQNKEKLNMPISMYESTFIIGGLSIM